ncbi:MAG: hypothetical protein NVS3B12_18920 [Acidimicrobiales bacterium]
MRGHVGEAQEPDVSSDGLWLRSGIVALVALVLHEAVFRNLRFQGVRPDVLLCVGIVVAIVGTPETGAVLAFAAALLGDLFVDTPFGLSALVAAIVAYGAGSVQRGMGASHRWSVPVLTAVASAAGVAAWAGLGTVLGLTGLLRPRLVLVIAVVATCNGALSIPMAVVLRRVFAPRSGALSAPSLGAGGGRGFFA